MNIKEITVTYGGKLNLGDYNSAHIELTATALLDEDDSENAAIADLFAVVKTAVRAEAKELAAKRGAKVDQIFAGLPIEARAQMNGGN